MEILNSSELINLLIVLASAAAVAGFMAGLLGVGGGIIMVPALYYAFTVLDFDIVTRMHLSVGTSLAIIIPTSIISTKTHMEYDAVDFKMVKSFGIFILLGVIAGTFLAVNLKTPAFGYDIRKSIGTAAAVGFLIAVSGTITMITGGKIIDNINTPFSVGYINLLGFIVFVPVTMIMARIGAKAVYKINKKLLSKIFGTFLIIVSIRSFFEYLSIN